VCAGRLPPRSAPVCSNYIKGDEGKPQGWQWKADAALFSLVPPDTQEALTLCMAQQHLQNLLPEATLNYLKPWFAAAQARFFSATGGRERRLRARSLPDSHRLD